MRSAHEPAPASTASKHNLQQRDVSPGVAAAMALIVHLEALYGAPADELFQEALRRRAERERADSGQEALF